MNKYENCDRSYSLLCICAIRYCFGRKTYMPSLVQGIVLNYIDKISDEDLSVILCDLNNMTEWDYGDADIDKPDWIKFRERIEAEFKKRMKNESD